MERNTSTCLVWRCHKPPVSEGNADVCRHSICPHQVPTTSFQVALVDNRVPFHEERDKVKFPEPYLSQRAISDGIIQRTVSNSGVPEKTDVGRQAW